MQPIPSRNSGLLTQAVQAAHHQTPEIPHPILFVHLKPHGAADACCKPESKTPNERRFPGSLLAHAARVTSPAGQQQKSKSLFKTSSSSPRASSPPTDLWVTQRKYFTAILFAQQVEGKSLSETLEKKKAGAGLGFQQSLVVSSMRCQQFAGGFAEEDKTRSLAWGWFFNPIQFLCHLPAFHLQKALFFLFFFFFFFLCLTIFDSSLQEMLLLDENY